MVYYNDGYKSNSYEFDEKGRLTRMGDIVLTAENSTRDEQGRFLSETSRNDNDIVESSSCFVYDETGRLKTESDSCEYDVSTFTYTRNNSGQIIEASYESAVGGSNKHTYKYVDFDTKHNWTKKTSVDSYGNKTVTTRKITYY